MQRLIKYEIIREKSEEIKKEIKELKEECKNLILNIEAIRNSYVGKDAEAMISAYINKIYTIKNYLGVIEEYNNYFEWVSGAYKDTKQKAEKNLNNKLALLTKQELGNEVFDLSKINYGGDSNGK